MGLSPYGCERMVAELLLGHQTACMLPRSFSGVLGDSGGLCGPPWVPKDVHCRVWVIGPHTHRGGGGVLHREGCRSASSKAFFVRFFVAYPPQ